jgi:phosphoribosyl 1,2-cyclic phosphate phosphodiesterase
MPIYCTDDVEQVIRRTFDYAFQKTDDGASRGYVPQLRFEHITEAPFDVLGQRITPVPLQHDHYSVFGFRIDDVAYCTDVSAIPDRSWPLLSGLRVLVIDALRHKPHPAHFSVDEAIAVIQKLRPDRAYLTHMSHELDHEATNRALPRGIELAYDGLTFAF